MIQNSSPSAPTETAQKTTDTASCTFSFDDRHWRVRGLEKQLSCERMKVNLMVTRRKLAHVDSLDLYTARQRRAFVKEAASELYTEEAAIKKDLGQILLELETKQDALLRKTLQCHEPEVPSMSDAERKDALELLQDPTLLDRILADTQACGLVGEATNKLVCYLACVSRHLPSPLAVLIQSSSGAGKTTLQDAVLRFMPEEQQVRFSALTGQSLYYMGRTALRHKVLAIAEEEGVHEACYALKLLQSEGRLTIASAEKDSETGRQQTRQYEVEGPVAMLLTTTAEHPDPELASRCITLRTNERPEQTAAIHERQRENYTHRSAASVDARAIAMRHQRAQRLLEPLHVTIPWADQLTFRSDQIHFRRDHAKYLALIASVTLLHQYQRKQVTRTVHGDTEREVIATLDDIEVANRLASAVLAASTDALLPQTRQLLKSLDAFVTRRAKEEDTSPSSVRFTQRELREELGWSDRPLRRQLTRLVELEYVLVFRTGRGNQRAYQLSLGSLQHDTALGRLGLIDVAQLRNRRPRRASRTEEGSRPPSVE